METKQQTAMGNHLLWSQGGWGAGNLAGTAEVSPLTGSRSLPRDPGSGTDLCLSLCKKAMPW